MNFSIAPQGAITDYALYGYGVTTCVVFYEPFMKGRRTFCCGDGSDYTLDKHEVDKAQQ